MNKKAFSILIQGEVQGVGFRQAAKKEADRLSLKGWIKNQADGTVYAEVCGDEKVIYDFLMWSTTGPSTSMVLETLIKIIPVFDAPDFRIIL
jgi:acylphosphatase